MVTVHYDQWRIWLYLAQFLFEWEMYRTNVLEDTRTHIWCWATSFFFLCENRAVREIPCENIVQPWRLQITIWRMRTECWITKATDTHSEYVTLRFSHRNKGYTDASYFYVICILTVWLCVLQVAAFVTSSTGCVSYKELEKQAA